MTHLDAAMLREFLGLEAAPVDVPQEVVDHVQLGGYRRLRLEIACVDG